LGSGVSLTHQSLAAAVRKARDQAKATLDALQTQRHPETAHSSALYLALVSIQKRLLTVDPAPPAVSAFVPELEQLVSQCEGKLAAIKPQIESALRLAAGRTDKS